MNFDAFGIAAVGVIVVVCYLVGLAAKAAPLPDKWIPIICGVVGGVIGVLGMNIIPEFPATDYITAAATGIVSGLAATGVNQVYKQLTKE